MTSQLCMGLKRRDYVRKIESAIDNIRWGEAKKGCSFCHRSAAIQQTLLQKVKEATRKNWEDDSIDGYVNETKPSQIVSFVV